MSQKSQSIKKLKRQKSAPRQTKSISRKQEARRRKKLRGGLGPSLASREDWL